MPTMNVSNAQKLHGSNAMGGEVMRKKAKAKWVISKLAELGQANPPVCEANNCCAIFTTSRVQNHVALIARSNHSKARSSIKASEMVFCYLCRHPGQYHQP